MIAAHRTAWLFAALTSFASGCGAGGSPPSDGTCISTEVLCASSLTVSVSRDLALDAFDLLLELETPAFDVRCNVPREASGSESCVGYKFADVRWDPHAIEITLIDPFYDSELNPDALPFESVTLRIEEAGETVFEQPLLVVSGEPEEPNGEGCPPTCWYATASAVADGG